MATLYIAEFSEVAHLNNCPIAMMPPLAEQTVLIGGSSTPSAAFGTTTRYVRIETDAICSIAFGVTPTASAVKARMAADQTEYFAVQPGHKVAVITNS